MKKDLEYDGSRIAKGRISGDIMFVDGENMSKLDIACIAYETQKIPKRLIYQTEAAARKSGYPGFEHVIIPRLGKESVDKSIAMDAVTAWHEGARSIVLVSNDRDYGATALHLKMRHPEIQITLVCDESRVSMRYMNELKNRGVQVVSLVDSKPLDDFACSVIEVIHELDCKEELSLSRLGQVLRERGIEYRHLKEDLIKHRVASPRGTSEKGRVLLSEAAKKHLKR